MLLSRWQLNQTLITPEAEQAHLRIALLHHPWDCLAEFDALFPDQPEQAETHRSELAAALSSRREIRRMAHNTVMLTALAVVHWNEKRLPEQRAELYESIIKWLIEAREQRHGRLPAQRCRQLLAELALTMQSATDGRQTQVTRRWAAERLAPHFGTNDEATDRADAFLSDEELDSGIIVRRGKQLRFWHLTFQEYLAAQALAGKKEQEQERLLLGPEPCPISARVAGDCPAARRRTLPAGDGQDRRPDLDGP